MEAKSVTTGVARCTATHKLFVDTLENDASRVWTVKHRACMDG